MHRRSLGSDASQRLGAIPLFAELSPGQRQMLGRLVDEIIVEAGETIMLEGRREYELVIIERGTAEVFQDGALVNLLADGDFFGELAVLGDGEPRSATVTATSELRGLVLTAHFMRELHDRLPAIGAQIERVAAERRARDEGAGR
jgi:CRP-like cAMP-binding protein